MSITKLQKGFTLVELLVVIAIIAILASVVLVQLNPARVKARDAKRIAAITGLQTALQLYADSCQNLFPQNPYTKLDTAAGYYLSTVCSPVGGPWASGQGFISGTAGSNTSLFSVAPNTIPAADAPCNVATARTLPTVGTAPVSTVPTNDFGYQTSSAGLGFYTNICVALPTQQYTLSGTNTVLILYGTGAQGILSTSY